MRTLVALTVLLYSTLKTCDTTRHTLWRAVFGFVLLVLLFTSACMDSPNELREIYSKGNYYGLLERILRHEPKHLKD